MDYTVRLNFNDGTNSYDFPLLQSISDPIPGIKVNVIESTRGSGSIVIPSGKRSIEIRVRGFLLADNYKDLTEKMIEMRNNVTTELATLTLKHLENGEEIIDWQYAVRRINEIRFPESMRTSEQEYELEFLVISY